MRNIVIILFFLVCGAVSAQQYFFNGTVHVPKTTAQINAIVSPQEGRQEANSDTGTMFYYNGSDWINTGVPLVDASGFSGNLDSGITDLQLLAEAVDSLTIGGGSSSDLDLTGNVLSLTDPTTPGNEVDLSTVPIIASALQSGDNVSELTNDAGYLTDLGSANMIFVDVGNGSNYTLNYSTVYQEDAPLVRYLLQKTQTGTASTITLDTNANEPFPPGTFFFIRNSDDDPITLDPVLGVNIVTPNGLNLGDGVSYEILDSSTGILTYTGFNRWLFQYTGPSTGGGTDDQTASEVPITDSGDYFTGTDVEGALQELGSSTIPFSGIDKTDDFTIADAEIGQIINIVVTAPDSIVVTYPADLTNFGFTKFVVKGTGFAAFDMSDITTTGGSFKTQSGRGESATVRNYSATEADVLNPNQLLAYVPVDPIIELHTGPNAASDPSGSEADATTGWTAVQVTMTSVTTDPQTGTYHMQIVSEDGASDRADYTFATENGAQYEVSIWAREAVGTDGRIQTFSNLTGWTTSTLTGSWTNYTQTVTATSTTGTIRIYAANAGSIGDTVYFDNISIVKVADP